jgi:hypothetical protein
MTRWNTRMESNLSMETPDCCEYWNVQLNTEQYEYSTDWSKLPDIDAAQGCVDHPFQPFRSSAMKTRLIAIAALTGFAAFGAQAFQGEENPLPPQPFQSMQSRSAVQAEARQPVQISNGGTGVLVPSNRAVDRATVRASAVAAARAGSRYYGERGTPM